MRKIPKHLFIFRLRHLKDFFSTLIILVDLLQNYWFFIYYFVFMHIPTVHHHYFHFIVIISGSFNITNKHTNFVKELRCNLLI